VEQIYPCKRPELPEMPVLRVNLAEYDQLLRGKVVA